MVSGPMGIPVLMVGDMRLPHRISVECLSNILDGSCNPKKTCNEIPSIRVSFSILVRISSRYIETKFGGNWLSRKDIHKVKFSL